MMSAPATPSAASTCGSAAKLRWCVVNTSGPKPAARSRASVRGSSIGSTSRPISRPPGWMRSRIACACPPPPSVQSTAMSPGSGRRHSSTSATMIGTCMPAGVLPEASTFSTSSA